MNEQQTPSADRWEPSGTPHHTATARVPAAPAPFPAWTATGRPSRLPARLRQRAAVGAAAAALLAVGGIGGFAVGQAAAGDGTPSLVHQGGLPGGSAPDGTPDFPPGGDPGTPPGSGDTAPDDGATDDGATDDGTTGDPA
ncbi:hypothetical protein LY71_11411 [Geodermatophilus tzadiensis]|uniref:Uncharacterized protein n=1 Tax=Geodermatophilus tzadiensis TaxID=1137988 RepID=A0A2T0TNU3_9ACTN|nr:hypothetical protein [Geodermatophilus tzadiensis]PRY47380.1 hypothetical protein LY71_11411 [Geodermatophilus tzadiensis]